MMTASDWKKRAATEAAEEAGPLTLPSGMVIQARRPSPLQVAMWGRLPLSLVAAAAGAEPREMSDEQIRENIRVSREVLLYCCVSPRISMDPAGDDEIHPREIPLKDQTFLLKWAMRSQEAAALQSFRGGSADAGPGGDSKDIRAVAEQHAANSRSGAGTSGGPGGGSNDRTGDIHFIG